jgi:hypothetical protein
MKQLVLHDKGQAFALKSVFILTAISLGLQLITLDPHSWLFWGVAVLSVLLIVMLIITRGLKINLNSLTLENDTLIIRWYNRLSKRKINVQDIAEITEEKNCISIKLKNERVIRLPVNFLEVKEKRDVRDFMKETTGL